MASHNHIPIYTDQFFNELQYGSFQSAHEILPQLLKLLPCTSVVDIGCGTGSWLRVCKELGVETVLGLDGDYVSVDSLQIHPSEFQSVDLTEPPLLKRNFDLALSLAVAEHLPETSADKFVHFLTESAAAVLFSAAIPGQGGTDHINEQWPEYWARKFEQRGYVTIDILRNSLWDNEKVMWWYAQNLILYVRKDILFLNPALNRLGGKVGQLTRIHPGTLASRNSKIQELEDKVLCLHKSLQPVNMSFFGTLRALPRILLGAVKRRFSESK